MINNFLCKIYFILLLIFLSPSNAVEDVMSYYLKQENPLNVQLIHLSTFNDILPRKQCLFDEALLCFKKVFEDGSCLIKASSNFNETFKNSDIEIEHTDLFREYFEICVSKNIHPYTTIEKEIIIPTLQDPEKKIDDDKDTVLEVNETMVLKHYKCIKSKIQECFFNLKCLMKSHDKIIDEILPFCRLEALQKLKSTNIELIREDNEDIDELSTLKIGNTTNLNKSNLPPKTIAIFQNLTYGHLEAVKMALIPWPKLKKDFCDPSVPSLTLKSPGHPKSEKILKEFIKRYPYVSVSKEIKNILGNITAEQFQAIKDVSNISTHFRWIICKSIVILSTPIKIVTKVQKNDECSKKAVPKFEPTLSNLKICRKWVLEDEFNKSGICK